MLAKLVLVALIATLAYSLAIFVRAACGLIAGPSGGRFSALRRIPAAFPLMLLAVPGLFITAMPGLPVALVRIDYALLALGSLIYRWDIRDRMATDLMLGGTLALLSAIPLMVGAPTEAREDANAFVVVTALATVAVVDLWTRVGTRLRLALLLLAAPVMAGALMLSVADLLFFELAFATFLRRGVLDALADRRGQARGQRRVQVAEEAGMVIERPVHVLAVIAPLVYLVALCGAPLLNHAHGGAS